MSTKPLPKNICGIVMPISAIDGCSENHWTDVQEIIIKSIEDAGFDANMVSHADDIGVIQKRIIQNLYDNPIVVCDISGKNPNVMFELGIRLAFDKPTIIIKDDKTAYSFDTATIEHIEYPRDLRFKKIQEFQSKLTEKIRSTHEKAKQDPSFSTFLKHFGEFKIAKIDTKEVTQQEFIVEEIRALRSLVLNLTRSNRVSENSTHDYPGAAIDICCENQSYEDIRRKVEGIERLYPFLLIRIAERANHLHIVIKDLPPGLQNVKESLEKSFRDYVHLDKPLIRRKKPPQP